MTTSRRTFLGWTAAAVGAAAAPLRGEDKPPAAVRDSYFSAARQRWANAGAQLDETGNYRASLTLRFLTDPERIARMLPPPLEPDDRPEAALFWFLVVSKPENGTVFVPEWSYGEADLMVSCKYRGHRCMTALSFPLDQDFGRYAGRQNIVMRKKDGRVAIEVSGDIHGGARIRAWTTRRGHLLSAIETVVTDQAGDPYFGHREVGWGWMRCSYALHPDWRRGPLYDGPVELWRVFGYDEGYPSGMPAREHWPRMARACDLERTRVRIGEAQGLDPWGEIPVLEMLGANFHVGGIQPEGAREEGGPIPIPRGPDHVLRTAGERGGRIHLEDIDPAAFEPWAFFGKGYDRPITRNRVWVPEGFPERATACKLTRAELERCKAREALELAEADVVEIDLALDPLTHRRALPPPLAPGGDPRLRVLGVRTGESDYSNQPFTELWLLARCELEGSPSWYALSHIVGWEGDVCFGRETWGYPSKHGEPEIAVDPMQIDVLGRRLERDFLRATLPLDLDPGGPARDELQVLGIRIISPQGGRARATWIAQPWHLELDVARAARPELVHLDLPEAPAPASIGRPDPWCDFGEGRVVAARWGRGRVLRLPGREASDFDLAQHRRFLQDRDEGQFGGGRQPSAATFLVGSTAGGETPSGS